MRCIGILCSLLVSALFTQSCAPLIIGGAAVGGVKTAQTRSFGNAVDDSAIWTSIKNSYAQEDMRDLLTGVGVEVNEGRVLLTGKVHNPETRISAVRLAWKPNGVKEVIDEINVTNQDSIEDLTNDSWITTQVKSKMLFNKDIRSINYSVETVNGVVYLIGIAEDQSELDSVTSIASQVRGVKRVINHVRLRNSYVPR